MKLKSSIHSNSVKLIDLYNKIVSGNLITGPDYQRKLVWKKQHKYAFIETILLNFPFPEIYIASSELNLEELKAREVVVDGQQRLTTIVDYIQGLNDFKSQKIVTSFDDLSIDMKREFLNYSITVKDLKDIGDDNIKEVFKRINSTNYSLNTNEVLNAQYGGGEFAIFCKLLADREYKTAVNETGIIIETKTRDYITSFFEKNKIFSDNDIKRMFDSQFIMLLCTTILEGQYFSRSSKINDYLEKYNDDFSIYEEILIKISHSLSIIDQLKLSVKSYWFNKANLYTLIIELIRFNNPIDLNLFESKLNDLESKADIYFVGDEEDLKFISQEEMKYFEVARQGSHELNARVHRGNVIEGILQMCSKIESEVESSDDISALKTKFGKYVLIIPTETGLKKGIMDATKTIRDFLETENIHNFESQGFGPDHKIKMEACFVLEDNTELVTEVSLYRSNGRGDYRIWFSSLNDFADANDELVLINYKGLKILNIAKFNYLKFIKDI